MRIVYTFLNVLITLLFLNTFGFAQNKQGNTTGADIFADAPYRMKKYNAQGLLQPIPIHLFVHDADGLGFNVDLINIDIKIKNARDSVFNNVITFNNLSASEFDSLLIHRSPNDNDLDIQKFDDSDYEKSSDHTIIFTAYHDVLDNEDYVKIDSKFWYFTLLIPPDKLQGFEDIIDIHIYFNIDWSTDDNTYLRIFRKADDLPKLTDWYRGDTHYHTIFTQNLVETGEALEATKLAGQYVGLDWQFATDHSCDFDNYGISTDDNWNKLGDKILQLNNNDTDYVFIRGMEMSVNNEDGKIVHALIYPSPDNPFSLPYLGDGGGDASGTSVSVNKMLDSLTVYKGMCYAAHPFAEKDKVSDIIAGSVWNINDPDFPVNGNPHPSNGTVICNDLSVASDVYSNDTNYLFKKSLTGFQIWNQYNTLSTDNSDNYDNPWNPFYETGMNSFSSKSEDDPMHEKFRFNQGFDVVKHFLKKGLLEKNNNPDLQHWKTYMLAGSDAHGSFNYSNTCMYYSVSGSIENNAIGMLSTVVYCPNGKGQNGKNILTALHKGHSTLSSGPVIIFGIDTDNDINNLEILSGDDTTLTNQQLHDFKVLFNIANTDEFGEIISTVLYVGTDSGEYSYPLSLNTGISEYNLYDLLNNLFSDTIPNEKYFYLRAELVTHKDYDTEAAILYKTNSHDFYSYTNPVWIKTDNDMGNLTSDNFPENIRVSYFSDKLVIDYQVKNQGRVNISLFNTLGQLVSVLDDGNKTNGTYKIQIFKGRFPPSIYLIKFKIKEQVYTKEIIL
jgi:hypothetical protein